MARNDKVLVPLEKLAFIAHLGMAAGIDLVKQAMNLGALTRGAGMGAMLAGTPSASMGLVGRVGSALSNRAAGVLGRIGGQQPAASFNGGPVGPQPSGAGGQQVASRAGQQPSQQPGQPSQQPGGSAGGAPAGLRSAVSPLGGMWAAAKQVAQRQGVQPPGSTGASQGSIYDSHSGGVRSSVNQAVQGMQRPQLGPMQRPPSASPSPSPSPASQPLPGGGAATGQQPGQQPGSYGPSLQELWRREAARRNQARAVQGGYRPQ